MNPGGHCEPSGFCNYNKPYLVLCLQSCGSNPLVDATYNAEEGDAGCT